MHVLFLTDNFPPEVNAPASRTFEHCREWVRSGVKVTVITGVPNFPRGKVYAGYRNRLWQVEECEGIRVIRVWTYIAANEGFLRRTLDYLSFMVTATIAALFVRGVDVVVGTSPQFFTACAARVVSLLKGRPWVFELRDIWPESIRVVGAMRESLLLRLLERLELSLYRSADCIVSVTHAFRRTLAERGIPADKIHVVTNGVDLGRFRPRTRDVQLARQYSLEGCFVAGYIGTHGLAHGLETLLDAAEQLRDRSDASDIRLLFLGDGARKAHLVDEARRCALNNVIFVDSVPKEKVPDYWSLLDVSIIHLKSADLFSSVIPSKLFECMGMGIPVLHGVPGESADIVRKESAGLVFDSGNAAQLAEGIMALRRNAESYRAFSRHALDAAPRYDRKNLAADMLSVLERLAIR